MARWEPDAYGRLRDAAFALFLEQGYEKTTVAQIAERAGLNRRTFFHHFADKREVVFAGQSDAEDRIAAEITRQPAGMDPLHAASAGLRHAAETLWEQYREGAADLGRLIAATPELQERELGKRAVLADRIATALRDRGTPDGAATVTAWTAVAVFFVARNRWNQPGNTYPLATHIDIALTEFRTAMAPAPTEKAPRR